jgi:hypothetical protein
MVSAAIPVVTVTQLPFPPFTKGLEVIVVPLELAIGEKVRVENTCALPATQAISAMIIRYVPLLIRIVNFFDLGIVSDVRNVELVIAY